MRADYDAYVFFFFGFGSGVSFAEPTLSGDNAVGVAVLAARLYRKTGADGQ